MGTGVLSKADISPLVSLCRERKEFIKAARDCRYDLATAHIRYFQSLSNVGNALSRFVEEELETVVDFPLEESEEGSHLKFSSLDSESELGSLTDYVHGDSDVSDGPKLSVPKFSEEDSHLKFSSMDSESELNSCSDYDHGDSEVKEGPKLSNLKPQGQVKQKSNVHLMRSSSLMSSGAFEQPGAVPMTVQGHDSLNFFHRDFQFGREKGSLDNDDSCYGLNNNSGVNVSVPVNLPYNYIHYPQDGNAMSYNFPMDMCDDNHQTQSAPAAPPHFPPPMPEVSAWDFIDPFNIVDGIYFCYYTQDTYEKELGSSNYEPKELSGKERMSDLEDGFEQNLLEEVSKEKMLEKNPKEGFDAGTPKAAAASYEDLQFSKEKGNNNEADSIVKKGSSNTVVSKGVEEENVIMEQANSEVEHAYQDGSFLGASSLTTLNINVTRNLLEAIKEIRDAFEAAFTYGKEVSVLFEAGRLPYQPMGAKIKVFALRILGLVAPLAMNSLRHPLYMLSNHSVSRKVIMARTIDGNLEDDMCRKYGDLSSTLEKLYMWEKKLYEEVKVEEKLRIIYDKECKKLRSLDDKGADFSKIKSTHASIKRLHSKINISVAAVDVISKRIHKLRDEELQPQLNELIEGLINMWKCVLKCHQKQFQAITEITNCVHIVKSDVRIDSNLKATLKLEHEILKWGTCFTEYIRTQKAFVKFLNEWLLRCLFQEPEDTPDGIAPFSPSRMGAPPIFVVCNDWYHAIEKTLETGVSKAIHDFASSLHQLWEKLDEEHCQSLKAEYLSKVFQKRLRHFDGESEIHASQNAPSNNATALEHYTESRVLLVDEANMVSLKKKLDEQKARHEEAIKQANDAASGCIQGGIVSIFQALELLFRKLEGV